MSTYFLRLSLYQLSTGVLHSEIKEPVLTIKNPFGDFTYYPKFLTKAIGDHIIIMTNPQDSYAGRDLIFVCTWRTGEQKLVRSILILPTPGFNAINSVGVCAERKVLRLRFSVRGCPPHSQLRKADA